MNCNINFVVECKLYIALFIIYSFLLLSFAVQKAATKPQPSKLFTTIDSKPASRSGAAAGTAHDCPNGANELDDSDLIPDTPDGKNVTGPCLGECLVTSGQTETKENSMETPQNIAQGTSMQSNST